MNNILKLSANWKALKLPELLEKLHQIVKLQYKDMRRSLHGQRNYTLAPWTKKFQVSTVVWESKTEEEKEQVFQKLLRFTVQKPKTDFFRRKVDHSENTDNSEKTRPTKKNKKCQNHDHYIMIHATVE